jgi:hypothetical protein
VVVAALLVVDLLLLDEPRRDQSLERAIDRRALAVDLGGDVVDRQRAVTVDVANAAGATDFVIYRATEASISL